MPATKPSSKKQMSIGAATKMQFSRAAKAGQLIRTAFSRLLFNIGDPQLSARLAAVMLKVVQTDMLHEYGRKTAGSGNLRMLHGFEFNSKKEFNKHFFASYEVRLDMKYGDCLIHIPYFNPAEVIRCRGVDIHFKMVIAAACFDFEKGTYYADIQTSSYHSMRQRVGITLGAELGNHCRRGSIVLLLGLQFYKKINDQYILTYGGGPTALRVVHTDQLPAPRRKATV